MKLPPRSFFALDIGSGYVKAKSGERFFGQKSLVGKLDSDNGIGDSNESCVNINGDVWVTGEDAKRRVKPDLLTDSLTLDWHKSDGYKALIYKSVYELSRGDVSKDPIICIALPTAVYMAERETIVEALSGKHSFAVNEKTIKFNLRPKNIICIPQVLGLVINESSNNSSFVGTGWVGVIEIGTYTTGVTLLIDGAPADWGTKGFEVGIHSILKNVHESVRAKYGVSYNSQMIEEAFNTGVISMNGRTKKIGSIIDEAKEQISEELMRLVRAFWAEHDVHVSSLILGGGGAVFFEDAVKESFGNVHTNRAGYKAVVDGTHDYGLQSSGITDESYKASDRREKTLEPA